MPSRRAYRIARARVLRHAVVPVREVAMGLSSFLVSARTRVLVCSCAALCRVGRAWAARGGTLCLWGCPRAVVGGALFPAPLALLQGVPGQR